MKTVTLFVMALLFAFTTATVGHAGTSIQKSQSTTVKAAVKNMTSKSVLAAVKLTGYDDAGTAIGKLCKSVYLGAGRTTNIDYYWKSPNYGTGVYWSSKVEVGKACPSTVVTTTTYDDHDDDDDEHEHDGDHDDDSDD
ncbi:MAG: hypothetical protein PHP95_11765 [Desulfuromonadaceae bacterium]|nr:hypothetical protein [Desulfuromonadaceae bacterium]MDD2849122.1 hypothetical protein [Desulfuromonadaceae bacterium]MDD4129490.1 hypothetical protein [Desulfuromonadaceae bacterium]